VPETEEWRAARQKEMSRPRIRDLFASGQARITWMVLLICAVGLTAHWAFMFWQQSFIRQHEAIRMLDRTGQNHAAVIALTLIVGCSIPGNLFASWLAVRWGYARALAAMSAAYGLSMAACFMTPWSYGVTLTWFAVIGICQGLFGLFTMCLPPLFPTLLRTTGAGFCYNTGRLVAAAGTVFFYGAGTPGRALLYASTLFIPATILTLFLPRPKNALSPVCETGIPL
jgi:hypothetical protein